MGHDVVQGQSSQALPAPSILTGQTILILTASVIVSSYFGDPLISVIGSNNTIYDTRDTGT